MTTVAAGALTTAAVPVGTAEASGPSRARSGPGRGALAPADTRGQWPVEPPYDEGVQAQRRTVLLVEDEETITVPLSEAL